MDIDESNSFNQPNEGNEEFQGGGVVPNCQNCYHLLNEIFALRMELHRVVKQENAKKKNFTIAPTLYTFSSDKLSKRCLAR